MALINEACNIASNSNAWLNYDGKSESSLTYFAQGQTSSLNGAIAISAFFVSLLTDGFLVRLTVTQLQLPSLHSSYPQLVRCFQPRNRLLMSAPFIIIAMPSLGTSPPGACHAEALTHVKPGTS